MLTHGTANPSERTVKVRRLARLLLLAVAFTLWTPAEQDAAAQDTPFRITKVASGTLWGSNFSPDGKTLAFMTAFEGVTLWDVASGKKRQTLECNANCLAFSPDNKTIALADWHGGKDHKAPIRLADVSTGKEKFVLNGTIQHPRAVAFAPDGKTLAVLEDNSDDVFLWNLETRKVRAKLPGHRKHGVGVAFSPDGKIVATSAARGCEIFLWDAATGRKR